MSPTEKHFVVPRFPTLAIVGLYILFLVEIGAYGFMLGVPSVWFTLAFGVFYLGYIALMRHDALPLIFAVLFLTAHHSLFINLYLDFPIALLFVIIFIVNSAIMWFLLHYGTHLKREYHIAYSLISGFMIAQIITLFASMARDWPFRLELASYMPTVFSYIFWRFACLSAESMLGWKQFVRIALLVLLLLLIIIIGSPNVQV
jgi:hypothetical protein